MIRGRRWTLGERIDQRQGGTTQLVEAGEAVGAAAGAGEGVLGAVEFEESLEEDSVLVGAVELPELVDALEEEPRLSFL